MTFRSVRSASATRTGLLVAALLLTAANLASAQSCTQLRSVDWLLGDWTASDSDILINVTWRRVSDTTLEGTRVELNASSSQVEFEESQRLMALGGAVFYLAKEDGNRPPILLRASACAENRLAFDSVDPTAGRGLVLELDRDGQLQVSTTRNGQAETQMRFSRLQ